MTPVRPPTPPMARSSHPRGPRPGARALGPLLLGVALATFAAGCAGEPSDKPPVHLVPDMDWQPKAEAFEASPLFDDGQVMRHPPQGTVAQGRLREDDAYFRGRATETAWVAKAPIPVDARTLARGEERYAIYCTPCHDATGSSKGMVIKRGHPPAVELFSDGTVARPDGEIFHIISNGLGNMPSYRNQIPVADRWAIVAWVRVLQRAARGTVTDVPADARDRINPQGGVLK